MKGPAFLPSETVSCESPPHPPSSPPSPANSPPPPPDRKKIGANDTGTDTGKKRGRRGEGEGFVSQGLHAQHKSNRVRVVGNTKLASGSSLEPSAIGNDHWGVSVINEMARRRKTCGEMNLKERNGMRGTEVRKYSNEIGNDPIPRLCQLTLFHLAQIWKPL